MIPFPSCVRVVVFSCGQYHWLAARFLSRLSLYFDRKLFQLYEPHFNPVWFIWIPNFYYRFSNFLFKRSRLTNPYASQCYFFSKIITYISRKRFLITITGQTWPMVSSIIICQIGTRIISEGDFRCFRYIRINGTIYVMSWTYTNRVFTFFVIIKP